MGFTYPDKFTYLNTSVLDNGGSTVPNLMVIVSDVKVLVFYF